MYYPISYVLPPPHFYHNIYFYRFVPPTYKIVSAPLINAHVLISISNNIQTIYNNVQTTHCKMYKRRTSIVAVTIQSFGRGCRSLRLFDVAVIHVAVSSGDRCFVFEIRGRQSWWCLPLSYVGVLSRELARFL